MKKRKGLILTGIVMMVASTVFGIGLAAYGFGPLLGTFMDLGQGNAETTEMSKTLDVPVSESGAMLTTIQSAGALPATCEVTDPEGRVVALSQGGAFQESQTADGRKLTILGVFTPNRPGFKASCDGSGEFAVVALDTSRMLWGVLSFLGFIGFAIGVVLVILGVVLRRRGGPSDPNPAYIPTTDAPSAPPIASQSPSSAPNNDIPGRYPR